MNEKAPEFISLFIDDNLKKGLKGVCTNTLPFLSTRLIIEYRNLTRR